MTKYCPRCVRRQMILFDEKAQSPEYFLEAEINWDAWPFEDWVIPANIWVCPRCGHYEDIGMDVEAQMKLRPRLL